MKNIKSGLMSIEGAIIQERITENNNLDIVSEITTARTTSLSSENSIMKARDEILREYAKNTTDKGDLYFIFNKIKDSDDYRVEAIIEKMTILAKRYGVRVFVIDNLMTVESSLKDKYEAETDIVKKLKNFAKKYNALVHLVAHPRKSMNDEIEKDDVAGSANITNLADYVTTISRAKDEEVEYDAILKILKNRHTGVNVGKKLMFSIERKRFFSAETEKELHKRYLDNFEQLGIDEWDNI